MSVRDVPCYRCSECGRQIRPSEMDDDGQCYVCIARLSGGTTGNVAARIGNMDVEPWQVSADWMDLQREQSCWKGQ